MKKLIFFLLALTALLCCQCTGTEDALEAPQFNEYVAGYTSGNLSRKSDVRIVFSQDVPQGRLDSVKASDILTLSPQAEGNYSFADAHTLVFTPTGELKRDTRYKVKVKVDQLFADGKEFQYSFQTRPFVVGGGLKSFDVTDDDQYLLTFNLLSADNEKPELVEKHVTCSMEGKLSWTHSADGLSHQLKVTVNPTTANTLTLTQEADKSICATEQVIAEVPLPSTQEFTVVSQRSRPGDSKCIEITFNKNFDPNRHIQGLVYVRDKKLQASIEGNKVLLYGDLREGEEVEVFVDKYLTSRSKVQLTPTPPLRVVISNFKPSVEFVGDGTIVPQSDRILIPFRSIYMKGVRVLIFKIFGNRVGTILQDGNLDSPYNFSYCARPEYATTFYIDDQGVDLSEWHTYAIDLTQQFRMEPGAMYRVELALDARLSAWPNDTLPKCTREEMADEDAQILEKAGSRFDQGNWYYTGQAYDQDHWWVDNYYRLRQDPGSSYYYDSKTIAKNVLATNIGLSALRGNGNTLSVAAINLPDALPMSGVKVEAYSAQQQVIGEGSTDGDGIAQIDFNPHFGQPFYLVARKGNDVSYLKVAEGANLSTSTFDVSGDVIQRGLKGYIYGERGVWRPGDTLHLGFMLNDRNHTLPAEHPVTLKLSNPLGQVTNRLTKTGGAMGLYTFTIPTAQDAPTGIWNAEVSVGGVSFNKTLRIESIKPNRLKIDLKLPEGAMALGSNLASLHTEWLNGNVAGDLNYHVSAKVVATTTSFKAWKDYVFDDPTKSFETSEVEMGKGMVDKNGNADVRLNFVADNKAPGMLAANLVTHVYEPSGEFSIDGVRTLVAPYRHFVGIKAPAEQSRQSHLDTDTPQNYSIVTVDKEGQPVANQSVQVDVYKVEWYWWWRSSNEEMVGYTASRFNKPVKTLQLTTDAMGQGDFTLNMTEANWGTYLIVASDRESGHSAGLMSYFDWPWMTSRRSSNAAENATALTITTDKKEYAPGEKMRISVPSEAGSRAIVSVSNGSTILSLQTYACQKDRTEFVIEATEEMMPNVYVAVSLVQPYEQTINDMPIRMYGIVPVTITSDKSHLRPQISCSDEFQPESKVKVTISEQEGRAMGYTLAIVDEGLLDLTRFKTPNAWSLFNAREALGVRYWDFYSHVNGAYGGRIEQLFSIGGDEALNNGPKAIVNRFTPMVYFAGPFTLKKGEKRTHTISVPNYNGRVRVMTVAGDGSAYGSAEKSVLVRKPLMMIATLPRQIGKGDEVTVSATLFATQALGDVLVKLSTSAGMQVVGEKSQQVHFGEAGDKTVQFRVKEVDQTSPATFTLVASGGGQKADYVTQVSIRTVSQKLSQTSVETIAPGAAFTKEMVLPGEEGHQLLLDVSATQPLNMITRLSQLIGYPHGCVEQTTSRAFPQLYLGEFTQLDAEQQKEVEENIKYCIGRLSSYQVADGGMAYWPGGKQSGAWVSAYVLHFLHEASSRGYYVPEELKSRLQGYVSAQANGWSSDKKNADESAYMFYVLALMQKPELGAMNRMHEHISECSATAGSLLSAAYALIGRSDVARELISAFTNSNRSFYWFSTDLARLLALNALDDSKAVEVAELIRQELVSDRWLSTSATSTSLIALSEFYKKHATGSGLKFSANINGKSVADVKSDKYAWSYTSAVAEGKCKFSLQNKGEAPLYLTYTQQGDAVQSAIERRSNGLDVSVLYTTDKDQPLDPSTLQQSTTFKACVTIRNTSGNDIDNVAVTHILPAGWEILSFSPSGSISYQDQRDDRLLSYIDRLRQGESVTIRLSLSATYAGQYYLPAISAEAMYDATVSGWTASGMTRTL